MPLTLKDSFRGNEVQLPLEDLRIIFNAQNKWVGVHHLSETDVDTPADYVDIEGMTIDEITNGHPDFVKLTGILHDDPVLVNKNHVDFSSILGTKNPAGFRDIAFKQSDTIVSVQETVEEIEQKMGRKFDAPDLCW